MEGTLVGARSGSCFLMPKIGLQSLIFLLDARSAHAQFAAPGTTQGEIVGCSGLCVTW